MMDDWMTRYQTLTYSQSDTPMERAKKMLCHARLPETDEMASRLINLIVMYRDADIAHGYARKDAPDEA